jgi:hypothetical protein
MWVILINLFDKRSTYRTLSWTFGPFDFDELEHKLCEIEKNVFLKELLITSTIEVEYRKLDNDIQDVIESDCKARLGIK